MEFWVEVAVRLLSCVPLAMVSMDVFAREVLAGGIMRGVRL